MLGFTLKNNICVPNNVKYGKYFPVEEEKDPEITYSRVILAIAVVSTAIASIICVLLLMY